MLFKKEGFPQEQELTLCTIKKILHNSVFAALEEYKEKEGIIHISEISPGRIRTIRDYVVEGKKVICTVLRVHEKSNHIELSLRRVSQGLRNKKNEELKLEIISEKILNHLASTLKIPFDKVVAEIGKPVFDKYGSLYSFFSDVVEDKKLLSEFVKDKKTLDKLYEFIKQRFTPPEVQMHRNIEIKCPAWNGIDVIKKSIESITKKSDALGYNAKFVYMGSPKYRIYIISQDYKKAESQMDKIFELLSEELSSQKAEINLTK